jgi:tetratricopeptide (TPR) repeat protein
LTSSTHQLPIGKISLFLPRPLFPVDKQHFSEFVLHFPESSAEAAREIYALKEKYPYSQLLHALAARSAREHRWDNQQSVLQLAAVHSTDRSVLKEIMSAAAFTSHPTSQANVVAAPLSAGKIDYADELIHDLERLQALKSNFEMLFADVEGSALETPEATPIEPVQQKPAHTGTPKPKSKTSRRERLVQLAKELAQQPAEEIPEEKVKRKGNEEDPLIAEIKEKRQQLDPENEKTKEQIEIIDQFIKSRPSASTPKKTLQENEDLASALKSGEFGDNVISETLAEILIRQGKKEKAIEVYRKLIWKFPQKKAYFAAQIEDLKK